MYAAVAVRRIPRVSEGPPPVGDVMVRVAGKSAVRAKVKKFLRANTKDADLWSRRYGYQVSFSDLAF